jgi:hypothetical protein
MHPRLAVLAPVALLALLGAAVGASAAERGTAQERDAPVVVELYTSQGCSSCPPADALLAELATRGDLIALGLHVDYWDYIGWEDPFALPANTARQRAYARRLDRRTVYTPQIVVDGTYDVIGSRPRAVANAIAMAAEAPPQVRPQLVADGLALPETALDGPAAVWLFVYDAWHETAIGHGENAGRRLGYAHVVRRAEKLADWDGRALDLPLDLSGDRAAGRKGAAVVVHAPGETLGKIVGAAKVEF